MLNIYFSIIFGLEMIIKLLGLGVNQYFASFENKFDAGLVFISILDISLDSLTNSNFRALQSIRLLRVLRVLKLAKFWQGFCRILVIM